MRGLGLGLLLLLVCCGAATAQDTGGVAVLKLADGTDLTLASWTLSYEYQAWKQDSSAALTQPARRSARELFVGKKVFPLVGGSLEIKHRVYQGDGDDRSDRGQSSAVTALIVISGGKRTEIKQPDPPHKDLLLPAGSSKGLTFQARVLDIAGDTLTGTRRDFCLVSYTPLVECSGAPSQRVVKLELRP